MVAAESSLATERRNGRVYLAGLGASVIGDSAMTLVAGIWVKSLTGSTSAAALVAVCVYAPSLLGPVAGLVADRVPPRTLLVRVHLAAAVAVLPLLLVSSAGDAWLVYVVMAAYGLSAVLLDPAESTLFAAMLSPPARARLNGLRLTLQESGKLVAPLAGAGLFAALGGGVVAALDALTFLAAAYAVTRLRLPPLPAPAKGAAASREPWRREVTAGVRHIAHTRELRGVVLLAAVAMAISGVVVAAQYDLVTALGRSPSFLGVLTGALGAGSIVAGLVCGRLLTRLGERTVLLLGLVDYSLGSVLRAIATLPTALAGSFVLGFALPWIVVAAITLSQRLTPQDTQGRVSSALTLALFAPLPVMQALGAALITVLDFRVLYIASAVVTLGAAGSGWARRP